MVARAAPMAFELPSNLRQIDVPGDAARPAKHLVLEQAGVRTRDPRANRHRESSLGQRPQPTGQSLAREFGPHQSTVAAIDFSKDGSRIACAHYGGVTVWSLGQVGLPPRRFAWRGSHVALRWSTDGKFIATGTQENDIHVWRMAQATDMRMQGYPAKVKSLSWTADARFLYTSAQPVFTAWPFSGKGPEGKPPLQFGEEGAGLLAVVAAHPAAEFVAGGYDSGELQLGDIKTRRSVVLKMADGSAITCLAWSPDGYKLAVGNDAGALLVIDLRR
jgi:WD40 repeat protein